MTSNEAQAIANDICKAFKVRRPKLSWSNRATTGAYSYTQRRIIAGPKCWRGEVDSFLHEIAHHVQYSQDGDTGHDPRFCRVLHDVAVHYYGCSQAYDWESEYASVRKLAIKRGWHTPKEEAA